MSLPDPAPGAVVVITGASSGIGAELARQLAGLGHDLLLAARREDRLSELAAELRAGAGIDVMVHAADLRERPARLAVLDAVAASGRVISGLCNNAGHGSYGRAWELDLGVEESEVRLNVETLHHLTLAVVPGMVERGTGSVLNVASVAAFQPVPGMATYAATKAFVQSFSEALHAELHGTGVSVTCLCPGPVQTEFGAVAGTADGESALPRPLWMPADTVTREAIDGMRAGRRSVVPGIPNKAMTLAGRLAPRTILLEVARRRTQQL